MAMVRVRYEKGVFTPLEPLHLEEGTEVTVLVEGASAQTNGTESVLEMFESLRASVPPDTWDNLPTDLVKNKKHYLYGHPKEEN